MFWAYVFCLERSGPSVHCFCLKKPQSWDQNCWMVLWKHERTRHVCRQEGNLLSWGKMPVLGGDLHLFYYTIWEGLSNPVGVLVLMWEQDWRGVCRHWNNCGLILPNHGMMDFWIYWKFPAFLQNCATTELLKMNAHLVVAMWSCSIFFISKIFPYLID